MSFVVLIIKFKVQTSKFKIKIVALWNTKNGKQSLMWLSLCSLPLLQRWVCRAVCKAPSDSPERGRGKLANALLRYWGCFEAPLSSYVHIGTPPPSGRLGGASPPLWGRLGGAFSLYIKNITKNACIIGWKIVTLHAFSEFKHIKIVEWRMTKWKWSTAWTSRFAFGKYVW